MEPRIPAIAVVQRAFGNTREFEGVRVEAGTRFAVEKPIDGLKLITADRYRQLLRVRLVRPLREKGAEPAGDANAEIEEPKARPTEREAETPPRAQEPEPPAPRRLNPPDSPAADPSGSPNGEAPPASSSPAAPASSSSGTTSRKPRKPRRGSAGSP